MSKEKKYTNKKLNKSKTTSKDEEMRLININSDEKSKYVTNFIKTAKYNIFTFLPLALFYQFNNYFNCFFLLTAVITSIPLISPLDPITAIGPFLFVISISLIREAIENIKKVKYDKQANNSLTLIYKNEEKKFIEKHWADILVGKILKIKKNEMIPADILIIKSSDENGLCYLETTNLDGESALKPRQSIITYQKFIQNENDVIEIKDSLEVDLPNVHIYKVEGYLYYKNENNRKDFFSIDNILLRGGRLKNTDYVYGVTLYTGRDTKIMKNIKEGAPKQSSIEKKLNIIIIYILVFVFILCIACTILGYDFRGRNMPDYSKGQKNAEYIFYYSTDSNKNQSNSNDTLELIRIFAGFFTIFNTLIPISIMISSEIIKTFQVNLIEKDSEMKKDQEDQFRIFSSKLHEDLGNVKYIFSDKTGTLTKNEMIFRACNIFCKTFGEIEEENNNNIEEMNMNLNQKMSVQFNEKGKKKSILSNTFNKYLIQQAVKEGGILNIQNLENSPIKNMGEACREFFFNISLNHNVLVELEEEEIHDFKKKENLSIGKNKKSVTVKPGKTTIMPIIEKFEDKSKTINEINEFENLKYQGSNPDEVVLVTAASEIGVSFLNKNKEYLHINFFNEHLKFKILQKFEFSSERKRSSVIVEDDLGIIKIYVKGSDEKILSEVNINNFSKEFLLKDTKDEIDSFARIGLRTLCFAYKEIKKQDYLIWEEEFNKLKQECIIDKSKNSLLEKFISKIEEDLILLGATALEDKLQDNVKIDLQEFIEGGISVWMITGDKLDTAESIGHSCRLFNDDTEVFKIKSSDKKTTNECLKQILKKIDLMKEDCKSLNKLKKQISIDDKKEKIDKNDKTQDLNNNNYKENKVINNINNEDNNIMNFEKIELKVYENREEIVKENFENSKKEIPYDININIKDKYNSNENENEKFTINKTSHDISNMTITLQTPKVPKFMENRLSILNDGNYKRTNFNYNLNMDLKENLNNETYINTSNNKRKTEDFSYYQKDNLKNSTYSFNEKNNKFPKNKDESNNKSDFSNRINLKDSSGKKFNNSRKNISINDIGLFGIEDDNDNENHSDIENENNNKDSFILRQIQKKLSNLQELNVDETILNNHNNNNDKYFENYNHSHKSNLYSVDGDENSNGNFNFDLNKDEEIESKSGEADLDKDPNILLNGGRKKIDYLGNIDQKKRYPKVRKTSFSPKLNPEDILKLFEKKIGMEEEEEKENKNKNDKITKKGNENEIENGGENGNENEENNNLDISDSEILRYLADNHFFDEGEGNIIYNPTFMGNIMNNNMNDTNNKILSNITKSPMPMNKKSTQNVINFFKNKLNYIKEQKNNSNNNNINNEDNVSSNILENDNNNTPIHRNNNLNKLNSSKLDSFDLNGDKNEISLNGKSQFTKNKENINIEEINKNFMKKQNNLDNVNKKIEEVIDKEKENNNFHNEKIELKLKDKKENEKENNEYDNLANLKGKNSSISNRRKKKDGKMDLNKMMEDLQNKIDEKQKKPNLFSMIELTKKEEDKENLQFKVMSIGLLIEGDSISHCLDDDLKEIFWTIVKNSKSVVCCRCSPKQKAEVVGFVKNVSGEITLAIGDGGNDIPMIKMADIGCGIFGKEGYQAAFNSDFAFSQFKYLKRLIYIHGRLSLLRNSYFVYFFFFKNVLFTLTQLWFCFFCGFSGQLFFDSWYLLGYNSFLTALPIAARSIAEEDIDLQIVSNSSKGRKVNLIPEIFSDYRDSIPFHILKFFLVFICAAIYSMMVYFIPYYLLQYNFQNDLGRPFSYYDHGLCSYFSIIITHFFIIFEDTYLYNPFVIGCYSIQIIVLFIFVFVHESLNQGEVSGLTIDIIQHFNFWAITIVTSSFSCLLFFIFRRLEFLFSDTIINNMMKNNFEADFSQKLYKKKIEEIRKLHRSIGKFKKLYKLKNEDLDNISDKRFKDIVDAYKRTHQFDRRNNIYGNSKKNYRFSHKKSKSVCFDKKNEDLDILKIIEEKNNNDFIANEKSKQIRYSTRIRDNNKYKFQSNPSKFNK